MRLHYHPLSPHSRKAEAVVRLRDDDVELRVVDVFSGELRSPAFRALSSFGTMPVLETDEGTNIESTSIIDLLEERGPRRLFPKGSERLARHFDRIGDLYLIDPMAVLWRWPEFDEAKAAPDVVARTWAIFTVQLEDGRPFVCGEAFSLSDLGVAIATDYLVRLGIEPPAGVRAWMKRCFELSAMRRSLDDALPFVEESLARRHGEWGPPGCPGCPCARSTRWARPRASGSRRCC